MHVLYIHQHFSTRQGAAGTRSYEMARKLAALGHSVTMICGSYGMAASGLTGAFRRNRREGIVDGIRVIEFDLAYSNRDGFTNPILKRFPFTLYFVPFSRSSFSTITGKDSS